MKIIHLFYYLLLICHISACITVYIPPSQIPTSFEKKQDISASAAFGLMGTNLTLAYSPVNHFYINASSTLASSFVIDAMQLRNYNEFAFGIGSYYRLNDNLRLEIQCGYGKKFFNTPYRTLSHILYNNYPIHIEGNYEKKYLVSFLDLSDKKQKEHIGVSLSLSSLNSIEKTIWDKTVLNRPFEPKKHIIVEPGMYVKFRATKHITLTSSANLCLMTQANSFVHYNPFTIRVGVTWKFKKSLGE